MSSIAVAGSPGRHIAVLFPTARCQDPIVPAPRYSFQTNKGCREVIGLFLIHNKFYLIFSKYQRIFTGKHAVLAISKSSIHNQGTQLKKKNYIIITTN
uniref:Uncharacterized protein n=1 Tax=Setaria viridis TaxID=4556 RepID=A0A4U6THT4_SETVI|nr:hypothetical protein SEVIR_8G208600v2 [Setaria viridis]